MVENQAYLYFIFFMMIKKRGSSRLHAGSQHGSAGRCMVNDKPPREISAWIRLRFCRARHRLPAFRALAAAGAYEMSMGSIRILLAGHQDRNGAVLLYAAGDEGIVLKYPEFRWNQAATSPEKKVFTGGVCVQCAAVVNLFYLFLEAGVCLHTHHDRYSRHWDPGLYDEDRDPAQGLVYAVYGEVGGDRGLYPDGFYDPQFSVFCQDSSLCIRHSIQV